jgi:hypothetical protein
VALLENAIRIATLNSDTIDHSAEIVAVIAVAVEQAEKYVYKA